MRSLFRVLDPPRPCSYLPEQAASIEYEMALLTPAEYLRLMREGWRRFGHMLFRPSCPACTRCKSLRVRAADFRPNRSQRRNRAMNEGEIELRIGEPEVTPEKLALYDRFHASRSDEKGWAAQGEKDASSYAESYVLQPFPVEEWCYYREGRLVGVGYADHLPDGPEAGMSAIYFFWEPDEARRGLGTWNVLSLIGETARRGLPYLYLGYWVEGCASMEYKPLFAPNEIRGDDGVWRPFR
ncbi:MAG: arginyltransferase [Gemmataceae bacterium]|nr:arginyltransferase [Gemmataceae bacterium]